jgi:uncharacterized protein YecA (UPF0149 family)
MDKGILDKLEGKEEEILNALGLNLNDITDEQKERLMKIGETISNPQNMNATEAMDIVNSLGLDIEKLQKNARRMKAELDKANKKPKVGRNAKCPCDSGKKYKKCCGRM